MSDRRSSEQTPFPNLFENGADQIELENPVELERKDDYDNED